MLKLAANAPADCGENVTAIVQLALTASEAPQLLVCAKSPAFAPVMLIPEMVNGPLPGFDNLTCCEAAVVPLVVAANASTVGVNTACGVTAMPVPDNVAVCGEPAALSATSSTAERLPAAAGLKMTAKLQLAPAARVAPQVVLDTEKSAGFVPVNVTPEDVIGALPVFDSVNVCAALCDPTAVPANVAVVGASAATGAGADVPVPVTANVTAWAVPPPLL
jgi:hypothetical protein